MKIVWAAGAVAGIVTVLAHQPGYAQDAAAFYEGKQIRLIDGIGTATTYHAYARLLARHMPKYLSGKPTIIVQSMVGAGSLVAYNHLYNVAPRDGTVIGAGDRFVPIMPLLAMEGPKFEAAKFTYIGSMNQEVGLCISWHSSPVKSAADMTQHELIVGTTGRGAELTNFTATIRNMLGARLKVVTGYPTADEINLAMERGEVGGRCGISYGSLKNAQGDWLRDRKINLLLQLGIAKDPELPDVPLIYDLAANAEDKQALELLLAPSKMGRPFVAPPEVPADRVALLRAAFDKAVADPVLIAEGKQQTLDINPMTGQEMAVLVARLYQAPPAVVQKAAAMVAAPR
jgi:tripartite-type tricarboxylate transporter receptor subunit TctC